MIDDPNVVLPLAISMNERGVAGYTHTVTNGEDQRKINSVYELAKNPMTGKGTLTLSKRQGVTLYSAASVTSLSASIDTAYLIIDLLVSDPSSHGLVYIDNSGQVEFGPDAFHSRTILSSPSGKKPAYADITFVSNSAASISATQQTIVLQIANLSNNQVPQRVFYNGTSSAGAGAAWTEITDADFTALNHQGKMEHMDGFALILESNNKIFSSDNNSLDNWNPANFISKQIKQDIPIGLARLSNKLLAFGRETVEAFYNAGNTSGSPLGRIPQLHQRIGLIRPTLAGGTSYYCTVGDSLFFVGRTAGGAGGGAITPCGLYKFDGFNFSKLSSSYIDKILSEKASSASIYSVTSMVFSGQQFVAICFTAAGASPQIWLMYSPLWNEWFEWNSTVFSPVNSGSRYLAAGSGNVQAFSYLFGSSDIYQDAGTSYQWLTQFRLPTNGSSVKRMVMYGVDADTDTSASSISVDVSDDDCQSFSSLQSIDLTRERKINFRGGSYTRRHVRLSATDARPKRIANFIANVSD